MANDGTALGALTEIIENAGGTSDAQTLVPAIEDLGEIIGSGGGIPFRLIATDAISQAIAARLGGSEDVPIMQPADLYDPSTGARLFMKDAMMLVWLNGTVVEGARLQFYGVLNGTNVIPHVYAKGNGSTATGVLGVDESWTIAANA